MYRLRKYEFLSMVIFLVGSLLFFELVQSLGVSELVPVDLKLLRGDSARFYFRIFALDSAADQRCSYSISGIDPLVVTFDEKSTIVKGGSTKDVYGTISVPTDAPIKGYEGFLTVNCEPVAVVEGTSGSVIKFNFRSGFGVSVVSTLEERAVLPVTPPPTPVIPTSAILTIVILAIIIIGTGYWIRKKIKK